MAGIASGLASITKADFYIVAGLVFLLIVLLSAIKQSALLSFPNVSAFIALLNSKGGLIFVLLLLWVFSFGASLALGLWALVKGISPQNAILMMLLSWVTGQAWGNANGALLKTMTGEQPPIASIPAPQPNPPEKKEA